MCITKIKIFKYFNITGEYGKTIILNIIKCETMLGTLMFILLTVFGVCLIQLLLCTL